MWENPYSDHTALKTSMISRRLHVSLSGLVYVIGLHAVQYGNNWMRKILRTAQIGRGRRPSSIWQSEEFFEFNYFQIGQHVVLLPIIYIASKNR